MTELAEQLARAFHKSGVAGAIAGLSVQGRRQRAAAGFRDIRSAVPMRDTTPVRIASVTKPIVAATAVLASRTAPDLLDRPAVEYLPELRPSWRVSPELTVRTLLSQSSGLRAEEDTEALIALGDGDHALLGAARLAAGGEH